jgi:hypothetical protein
VIYRLDGIAVLVLFLDHLPYAARAGAVGELQT